MDHQANICRVYCNSEDLRKSGHSENGTQRWLCNGCKKSFQLTYRYNARKPGVKEQITELTMNSSGVRDISRILQITPNTVVSELKKTLRTNPYLTDKMESEKLEKLEVVIDYRVEADELWSFVGNKGNPGWTWYAMDKDWGIIVAWHNGKRTDHDFLQLSDNMKNIPITRYYTDNWGSYSKYLPEEKHVIGKDNTWKIERKNLNFRTHRKRLNRKTICYSRNEQVHDNVIGLYIDRFYYKTGKYTRNGFKT